MKLSVILLLATFLLRGALIAQVSADASSGFGDPVKGPLCGGVERWDEKVLTDASAYLVNYTPKPTTIDSLIHIPTSPNANAPRMAGIEFQSYRITCSITIKKNEDDNDYHLVLKEGNKTMIGEVPDPVCAVASTSAHVNEYIDARNWVNSHIGTYPNSSVNLPLVEITGVAFVDVPHGQTGAAPNQMEIHPILNIKFLINEGITDPLRKPAFTVIVSPSVFSESTRFCLASDNEMFGKCRIEVYTQTGNKVKNLDIPVTSGKEITYTFHREKLAAGLYIYRILNNDSILNEGKIIIQ